MRTSLILLITLAGMQPLHSEDDLRTVRNGCVGGVTPRTTPAELEALFGADNIRQAEIDMGEGTSLPGVKIFEGTDDFLELVWEHDPKGGVFEASKGRFEPVPSMIYIRGSNWKTVGGIGVGSSLAEVAQANGKAFELAPFETCEAGVVLSWNDGNLEPGIRMRFGFGAQLDGAEYQEYVFAGNPFLSSDPELARMKPSVALLWQAWGGDEIGPGTVVTAAADKRYTTADQLVAEIRGRQEPWGNLYTIVIDGDYNDPPDEDKAWTSEVLVDDPDFICLQLVGSIPDNIAPGSASASYVAGTFLLQSDGENGFQVVDLLTREGSGYGHCEAVALAGVSELPLIRISEFSGGRRLGRRTHQIFSIVRTEDGVVRFEPSLAFDATYTQFGRNESCRFSVADGRLQVTVTHDWMKNPEKQTESRTVTLPWNPESRTFDVGPLEDLVSG